MGNIAVIDFIKKTIMYSYRGLFSIIYFIIGKKNKIDEMIAIDNDNQVNLSVNDSFVKREKGKYKSTQDELMEKISFRYKAKDQKGKIVNDTFEAYNIEQAKKYLKSSGVEVLKSLILIYLLVKYYHLMIWHLH